MGKFMLALAAMVLAGHLPMPALASAWVQPIGDGIVTVKQETMQQNFTAPAGLTYQQRLRFQEIYGEYGLTPRITITAKHAQQNYRLANRRDTNHLTEAGIRLAAPQLATGLLPPFTYDILSYLAEPTRLHREKKAALHFFVMDYDGATATGLAVELADKIYAPNWSFTQTLRIVESDAPHLRWSQAGWTWMLGYRDRLFYGRRADIFENGKTRYRDIRHHDFVEYAFSRRKLSMRLSRGRLLNVPEAPGGRLRQISLLWRF